MTYEGNAHLAEEGRDMPKLDQCVPGRARLHVSNYLGGCTTEDLRDLAYYSQGSGEENIQKYLKIGSKKKGERKMTFDEFNLSQEYSEEFDRLRKNRVEQSFYKYGPARKNYRTGYVKAIPSMERCLVKYNETGNREYLVDAANYLMFEYMFPQHPKAHFRQTPSEESAGIVGISVAEMEKYKEENC